MLTVGKQPGVYSYCNCYIYYIISHITFTRGENNMETNQEGVKKIDLSEKNIENRGLQQFMIS